MIRGKPPSKLSKMNPVTDLFSTNLIEACAYAPTFTESQVADFTSAIQILQQPLLVTEGW